MMANTKNILVMALAALMLGCNSSQPVTPVEPTDTTTTSDRYEWKLIRHYQDPALIYSIHIYRDNEIWFGVFLYKGDTAIAKNWFGMACWKDEMMTYYEIGRGKDSGSAPMYDVRKYESGDVYGIRDGVFTIVRDGRIKELKWNQYTGGRFLAGSENSMYFLQYNYYYHYKGGVQQRVDFSPDRIVNAVHESGETVYATLSNPRDSKEPMSVLIIEKEMPRIWEGMPWTGTKTGIYVDNRGTAYFCGPQLGKYENGTYTDALPKRQGTLYDVRGSAHNNVWTVGTHGTMYHFNGKMWTDLSAEVNMQECNFYRVRCSDNLICALYTSTDGSGIVIGKKMK